jgi:pyrroline-5-carboxylate reductase
VTTADQGADLSDFSGLLVLVGAGKMGSALLEGWLRLGLDPKNVAVLEPQPTAEIVALAGRGLRLNPDPRTLADAAAIVIAIKPQIAAETLPALTPLVSPSTVVVSIMALRLGARHAEYAGRDRPRHHRRRPAQCKFRAARAIRPAPCRRRRGGMDRR